MNADGEVRRARVQTGQASRSVSGAVLQALLSCHHSSNGLAVVRRALSPPTYPLD